VRFISTLPRHPPKRSTLRKPLAPPALRGIVSGVPPTKERTWATPSPPPRTWSASPSTWNRPSARRGCPPRSIHPPAPGGPTLPSATSPLISAMPTAAAPTLVKTCTRRCSTAFICSCISSALPRHGRRKTCRSFQRSALSDQLMARAMLSRRECIEQGPSNSRRESMPPARQHHRWTRHVHDDV
jgi:hypothetical protein